MQYRFEDARGVPGRDGAPQRPGLLLNRLRSHKTGVRRLVLCEH